MQEFSMIKEVEEWYEIVREGLLKEVMAFWRDKAADRENGGYRTDFDREGNCTGEDKNIWLHARQVWMFSTIWEKAEQDAAWLDLAKTGRDYIITHAYAGNGRWNYLLDRNGKVVAGTISFYTDMFVLMGLAAYAEASGDETDIPLIRETFAALAGNVRDDRCKDTFPQVYQEGNISHGKYMICLNAVACARRFLDGKEADGLMRYCMERIFEYLGYGDDGMIHEVRTLEKGWIDSEEGHRINPGHIFESMWFVLESADDLGMPQYKERALSVIDAMYRKSHDREFGGIFHMLDDRGENGLYRDWNRERDLKWDEKVWWTHGEALCALLTAADRKQDEESWREFKRLYQWCRDHFYDREYGEWYAVLNRDGTPRITDKGGLQKAAFHVPRSLCQCLGILGKYRNKAGEHYE